MSGRATIFAQSTAPGRAGIAVLRMSGPDSAAATQTLTGRELPPPREARLRSFRDAVGETIDRGLLLWLPGPGSFTGEDMAELHVHGGRAVVNDVVAALAALPGLRPAEPGEFTRRAFDNGRLDLTEVEGLADLIAADTAAQRRQALRQLGGALGQQVANWRDRLLRTAAHLEAAIDFSDEELPAGLADAVQAEVTRLADEMAAALADDRRGERLRDGLSIAILGAPNAGKSSLLNALARREAAIVAETAGTTRDIVEVHLDLGGYPVTVADTAGLRELAGEGDGVEAEGIRRARARAEAADLKLAVFDLTAPGGPDRATRTLLDQDTVVVLNKRDLAAGAVPGEVDGYPALALSAAHGVGLDVLLARLQSEVEDRIGFSETAPAITRARHREALAEAQAALVRAQAAGLPELAAEDVRLATRALGRITGQVDVEDLLDVIFRDFCIGK